MDFSQTLTLENTSYLWGSLLLLPAWMYGFVKSKDSRKEILICGVLFGLAGIPLGYIYCNNDYWNPPYIFNNIIHLEDFIYGFLLGGISSEIYEILFGYKDRRKYKRQFKLIFIFILITLSSILIMLHLLHLNSIIANIVPPFIVGLFSVFMRRDLIRPSVISGIAITILTFIWQTTILLIYPEAITDFWMLENMSQIFILGVPIEELLFAFSLGFGASTFYELVMGNQYYKKR